MGRKLSDNEVEQVLLKGTSVTIGMIDESGHPETAALTYVWDSKRKTVLLHGSKENGLMKRLAEQETIAGTIVVDTEVDAPEFTLRYRSVNLSGSLQVDSVENFAPDMALLCAKYLGKDYPRDHFARTMSNLGSVLTIFKWTPDSLSGRGHDLPKF